MRAGLAAALRQAPLLAVLLIAAWPAGLYLLQLGDPEAAVRLAQSSQRLLQHGLLGLGAALGLTALVFPPARTGLWLLFARARTHLTADRGPLLRALGDLQHFASPARHLEVGRLALQLGDLPLAARHLGAALQGDPAVAAAHFQLGRLLLRLGRPGEAAAAFAAAEQRDPGYAFGEALLLHGRARWLAGDPEGAAAVLQQHRARHGGSAQSLYWLGQALLRCGDRAAAGEAFAAAAATTGPRSPEADWYRAWARLAARRHGVPGGGS